MVERVGVRCLLVGLVALLASAPLSVWAQDSDEPPAATLTDVVEDLGQILSWLDDRLVAGIKASDPATPTSEARVEGKTTPSAASLSEADVGSPAVLTPASGTAQPMEPAFVLSAEPVVLTNVPQPTTETGVSRGLLVAPIKNQGTGQ
ncbi:MAG: hypothetical protein JXQ84_05625 [Rhodospirillaceae bacterium]|nr:hypothetical protein [Rhodospirillaceae bacterium]